MRALRLKLIAILAATVILPAVPATLTVTALFHRSLGAGAEEEIARGARAGLAATRELLEREKRGFREAILAGDPGDTLTAGRLGALSARERETLRFLGEASPDPAAPAARGLRGGSATVLLAGPERVTIEGRQVLAARVRTAGGEPRWILRPLPERLAAQAEDLTAAVRLVESLRRERESLTRGLVLTFVTVYGVVLLLVVLLGMLAASRLTRPLEALAGGIDRVAEGDLAARIAPAGEPGVARLIDRFNEMAGRLERQRDELVRLEKLAAWRNIARRLAHEIKNPLTPIRLAVAQIRDTWRGEDPEYRAVLDDGTEIVEEEIEKLRALTREFSEFARMPAPEPRKVRVRALLEETAALYGEGRVRLDLPAGSGALAAWCDPEEIHRVLVNLVNNALEAQEDARPRTEGEDRGRSETGDQTAGSAGSREGEPVELGASAAGAMVAVEVRDRGPGVPPADRRRIFAPDYSTRSEGMGLGLAIVDEILRAHGGAIEVRDREGGGGVFRILLPAGAGGGKDAR